MTPRLLPTALAFLALLASPARADIWQRVPSNTTDPIIAIDYQSESRFWFATSTGKLFHRRADGTFAAGAGPTGAIFFTDLAFEPAPGNVGIAVGNDNNVWRSSDGGASWTKVTLPAVINNPDCSNFGGPWPTNGTFDDAFSVAWATADHVYVTGNNGNVLKSTNNGGSWSEINHKPDASDGTGCRVPARDITDQAWLGGSDAFFIERSFGGVFRTSNALASNADTKAEAINNYDGVPRMAADVQNRVWAIDRCLDCYAHSSDGGVTFPFAAMKIRTPNAPRVQALHDVAQFGGTVVAAGTANQVINSINGTDFFFNNPGEASDWKAVDLYDAAHAAIGGAGGALLITDKANTVPDIEAPRASIQGPATATAGIPVTFTATVSDTGGSGVDPNGYTWMISGFPNQSGQSATYTFATPGFYTVRLTVKDLAGNVSQEVTKSINVSQRQPTQATFIFAKGGIAARTIGRFVRITVRGKIRVPTGINRGKACTGRVLLTLKVRRRPVRRAATATVKADCSFRKSLRIRRSKLRGARKLKVTVHFGGNTVLRSQTKTYTVKLR